jgi:uncharacterized protein involved in exopolysaccharide biosynthesis
LSTVDHATHDDQIDIRAIINLVWLGRKLIALVVGAFATVSVIIALLLPNQYTSVAVLAPAYDSAAGMSNGLSQISGLASFAGVKLGSSSITEAELAVEVMKSWGFIERFIEDHNLEVDIYAAKGWDRESNSLIIDSDLYDEANQKWLIETADGTRGPTSWELYNKFSENISVTTDFEYGLVSLSFVNYSPFFAKELVDLYTAAINRHMQNRKMSMVNKSIKYLQEEIEKSSIAGMHQVFYTIIEDQIKTKMLAEATPDHTFVLVSPSMVPEKPSQPRRLLICVLGTFMGLMLSFVYILIKGYQGDTTTQ